jgi:hypothetical protein
MWFVFLLLLLLLPLPLSVHAEDLGELSANPARRSGVYPVCLVCFVSRVHRTK